MRGDDAMKPSPDALVELDVRFGAGDDVPTLLHEDLFEDRVALGRAAPQLTFLPLAEEDLPQIGYLDGRETETSREWRGRLVRPPERRHINGRDRFVAQSIGEELGLLDSDRIEARVSV